MANYKVEDLIKEVRIAIDQNMQDTQLETFADADALALSEIVRSKLEDAARIILSKAPLNLCGGGKPFLQESSKYDTIVSFEKSASQQYTCIASVQLPNDFMRLLLFKMKSWARPLRTVITPEHPRYDVLRSKYGGVSGHASFPDLVQIGDTLEAYGCTSSDDTISVAQYLPLPQISKDSDNTTEVLELPMLLRRSVVYMAAYLTCLSFGADVQAQRMLSVALQLAEISTAPTTQNTETTNQQAQ